MAEETKNMEQDTQEEHDGLTRRDFVKNSTVAGAAAAAAGAGLFGGQAPAYAQSRELHILEWSSFIAEADELTDQQAAEFGKMEGINVRVEHINLNGMAARATAAVESGTGPDILRLHNNFPWLYAEGLIDHSNLVADVVGSADNLWPALRESVEVDGTFRGVPAFATGGAWVYNRQMFEEAGTQQPETWDQFIDEVGPALKNAGYPVGQALGHSFGDPNGFAYTFLFAHGGQVVDENGRPALDNEGTRLAVQRLKDFWSGSCDESGLGWDDGSNNRAFFARTISTTLNGASIYFVARRNWDENEDPFRWRLYHYLNPVGPAGRRFHTHTAFSNCITRSSDVQTAAQNYVKYVMQDQQFSDFMWTNRAYVHGVTPEMDDHPVWVSDPAITPFKDMMQHVVTFGWPGPYNRQSSELLSRYIVVDMFARAARGDSVNSTVRQAADELNALYS